MQNTNQKLLISCLLIGLLACLCLSAFTIFAAAFLVINSSEVNSLLPSLSGDNQNTRPDDINAQMDLIEQQVIELRGLEAASGVSRAMMSPSELRQRVEEDFLGDYTVEEAAQDSVVLHVFGLLEADFDLRQLFIEMYSEQIAGFYDDETKEMYVIQDGGFLGPQRMTYAHEYVHALQDANYGFEDGLNYTDESCEADSERCAAIQALVEGDASALEMEWFSTYATRDDEREISQFYANFNSPVFDSAPSFLSQDLVFPYSQGADFVQHLLERGGWQAVNDAYANLPVSTEQILHPERYPDDRPQNVSLPDLAGALGPDWEILDEGVMGEWYTFLILAHGYDAGFRLRENQASQAAAGWGGDRYLVLRHRQSGALTAVMQTVWDAPAEATEFARAFVAYGDLRFGAGQSGSNSQRWQNTQYQSELVTLGDQTIWWITSDASVIDVLRQALQLP